MVDDCWKEKYPVLAQLPLIRRSVPKTARILEILISYLTADSRLNLIYLKHYGNG